MNKNPLDWWSGLHRVTARIRCAALDVNGHRCGRSAKWQAGFRGDNESWSDGQLSWVWVALCEPHANPTWSHLFEKRGSR